MKFGVRHFLIQTYKYAKFQQNRRWSAKKCRKGCELTWNVPIFKLLCKTKDEDFDRLLLHTEVKWLSKGNCLKRFYELYDSVIQFLEENRNVLLVSELKARKCNVAFLTDLFNIFNEVNLKLQDSEINIVKVKSVISLFVNRLLLHKQNIGHMQLSQFFNLNKLQNQAEYRISDDDLSAYCNHLLSLHEDWKTRFEDIIFIEIPDWIINPFMTDVSDTTEFEHQEELLI